MTAKTSIEWTDATWNPTRGCSRVSEGCRNCYAERIAGRFSGKGERFEGFARLVSKDPNNDPYHGGTGAARQGFRARWTGRVDLIMSKLDEPLRWRKPQRVFVNSMSDLFHEALQEEAIAAVFGVMAAAQHHTFQILTKRPERMRRWFQWLDMFREPKWEDCMGASRCWAYALQHGMADSCWPGGRRAWPLPNVWLGVSVEDQATADERVPVLLTTPAAKRFVSYEPALGPVDFRPWLHGHEVAGTPFDGAPHVGGCVAYTPPLDWVIVGGESGPGARPFDVAWARTTVRQCRAARVPVFVKQLGANVHDRNDAGFDGIEPMSWPDDNYLDRIEEDVHGYREDHQGAEIRIFLRDRKGVEPTEWPEDLRVREFPS